MRPDKKLGQVPLSSIWPAHYSKTGIPFVQWITGRFPRGFSEMPRELVVSDFAKEILRTLGDRPQANRQCLICAGGKNPPISRQPIKFFA